MNDDEIKYELNKLEFERYCHLNKTKLGLVTNPVPWPFDKIGMANLDQFIIAAEQELTLSTMILAQDLKYGTRRGDLKRELTGAMK